MDARAHLQTLVGQTVYTIGERKPNRILGVEGPDVIVATEKSPLGKPVPIDEVQAALDILERDGELHISVESVGYRSAFIGAVLATLAEATISVRPRRVRLRRS